MFFIRAGHKPVEFEKGKSAIAVPSLEKLPSVIDTLIDAIRNGELDDQLARQVKWLSRGRRDAQRDVVGLSGMYAAPECFWEPPV